MESAYPHPLGINAEKLFNTASHLFSRFVGKGNRHNRIGRHLFDLD